MNDIEKNDRELFNNIADDYAKKDIIKSTSLARKAITLRAVKKIISENSTLGTVLDVGCGAGTQAFHLKGLYNRYIGVDYAEKLIEVGRKITKNLDNVTLIDSNIKDINLEDKSVDTILIVGGLHHMTDFDEIFRVFKKVAKPGANLVAIEPQRENPLIQLLRKIRMKINPGYSWIKKNFTKKKCMKFYIIQCKNPEVEYTSFLTQPFAQVVLKPQFFFIPLVRVIISLENFIEKILPKKLGKLSWCINVYCKF